MSVIKEIAYPNSIGFLWEKLSKFLGFSEYDAAKVMGLTFFGDKKKFHSHFQKSSKLSQTEILESMRIFYVLDQMIMNHWKIVWSKEVR